MTPEGRGGFALIVGPSGAGKDTLIALARAALAGDPRFVFPKRIVTRPSSAFEEHDTLDEAAFARAEAEGRFALSWRAHGLGYAVPRKVLETIRPGRIAVCNVSRGVVEEARRTLPQVAVIEVTAPVEVLAERLAARGRNEDGDLGSRLARAQALAIRADASIVNDRSPEEGAGKLVALLRHHADAFSSPLAGEVSAQRAEGGRGTDDAGAATSSLPRVEAAGGVLCPAPPTPNPSPQGGGERGEWNETVAQALDHEGVRPR